MKLFSKIAAVKITVFPLLILSHNGMVAPLPDKASRQRRIPIKTVKIFFQCSRSVSHGMSIFRENQRFLIIFFKVFVNDFQLRIHHALYIQTAFIILACLIGRYDQRLVVYQPGGIQFPHHFPCLAGNLSVSGFIAQRPEQDAGTVFVSHHKSVHTVQKRNLKLRVFLGHIVLFIVPDSGAGPGAVSFNICLIHYIKAVFIAEPVKFRAVWIVGSADGINIGLFHETQIPNHALSAAHKSGIRVTFVSVDAL